MKKICEIINAAVFFGFIVLMLCASILLPKKDYSEEENRYLAELPSLSAERYFSGEFTDELSSYMDDHFPLRTNWISLHTRLELLQGRRLVNGVYISDGRMIQIHDEADYDAVDRSVAAISEFSKSCGAPVYLTIVPTAAEIYSDEIPDYSGMLDQRELISYVYECLEGDVVSVDVYDTLRNLKDEYIYYRTDHHWTSQGAYAAYTEVARRLGFVPASLDRFDIMHASHSFLGSLHSKTLYDSIEPDSIDFYISNNQTVTLNSYGGEEYRGSPYLSEYLSVKDKYLSFLGQNTPLVNINSDASGARMLVIKDSYANCFVPFLAEHYSSIDVIDLRYITNPNDYINPSDYDCILILYNAENFSTDTNLAKLSLVD